MSEREVSCVDKLVIRPLNSSFSHYYLTVQKARTQKYGHRSWVGNNRLEGHEIAVYLLPKMSPEDEQGMTDYLRFGGSFL